jgi:DNA helicase-2/ATP-dependent DNA helicase PcrA
MSTDNFEIITSDQIIDSLDNHFKIIAGPGAGKTYWLVNYIKYVLKNSKRIKPTSKIACITYTNVAAEEIQERLNLNEDNVEVSTIHSFLYKNIAKPYAYILKDENGKNIINITKLDGHEENVPTKGKISQWKELNNLWYLKDDSKIKDCLSDLGWFFEDGDLKLQVRNGYKRRIGKYYIPKESFYSYKKLHWDEGILHHEDVLYFSYQIIKQYPIIKEFIAAKYPYIFLDEFQDTNPIQTKIIKWLAESGSMIGVIGDPAQSIYKFQGASRKDFIDFSLPGQRNYKIESNRRSSNKIINFLNYIRKNDNLKQECFRKCEGASIYVIESDDIDKVLKLFNDERLRLNLNDDYCILTYNNESVIKLKNGPKTCDCKIWDNIHEADYRRERFLKRILTAQEFAYRSRYEMAIKEILKTLKTNSEGNVEDPFTKSIIKNDFIKRSIAVSILEYLINNRTQNIDKKLYNFYNDLNDDLLSKLGLSLRNIRAKGNFKILSESLTIRDLINSLKLEEEKNSDVRTIHKAKGTEYQSILVYIENNEDIRHILNPEIDSEEDDCRIYYVAFSRAEDFLCIAVPKLNKEQKRELTRLGFSFIT